MKFPGTSKRRGASPTPIVDPRAFRTKDRHLHRPQQQSPQLTNEYEYVRREHGFDFMPPSRYVPSRSMSEDTDEYSDDPQIQLQMTESDLTAVEVEYDQTYMKPKATPVVRGKTIKATPYFKSNEKRVVRPPSHRNASNDDQEARHRLQMKLVAEEFKQKNSKSHWYQSSTGGRRDPNIDEYSKKKHRGSRDLDQKRNRRNHANLEMDIPTAYSYTSEESRGAMTPKESRYNMRLETGEKEVYRPRGQAFQSPASPAHIPYRYGWTRSSRDVVVKDFSKPTFQKATNATNTPRRAIASPREHRSDKHRRSHSRETREPPPEVYIEPPLDVEARRHGQHRDNGYEPPLTDPRFEMDRRRRSRHRDHEPEPHTEMESRHRSRRREHDREASPAIGPFAEPEYHQYPSEVLSNNKEKRRPGVLSRFMNTVRGEKSRKGVMESGEWHNREQYEQERIAYGRSPGSFESEVTPYYPPRRYNVTAGVPYPFEDDDYYTEGPIVPKRGHSSNPRQPPRNKSKSPGRNHRSQTEPVYEHRPQTPDRVMRRSSKPSHTGQANATPVVYATSPRVHGGPDHHQRAIRHHIQYPSQHHGAATTIKAKGNRSPGTLQFNGAQVGLRRGKTKSNIYHP